MTQYQVELAEVKKNGGDVEEFKKQFRKRTIEAYRNHNGSESDFRRGNVKI